MLTNSDLLNPPEKPISISALSLILFFIYQETEKSTEKKIHFLSKESSILVNNWFMMYFLSVVLIGICQPCQLLAFIPSF